MASRSPGAAAVVSDGESLAYGELVASVEALAERMRGLGIGPGDRVALCLPNGAAWVRSYLALCETGAAAVLINARYPVPEVARILTAAGAAGLVGDSRGRIGDAASLDALYVHGAALEVVMDWATVVDGVPATAGVATGRHNGERAPLTSRSSLPAGVPLPQARGDEDGGVATVFASSGSTGAPKLIGHSQAAIADHSRAVAAAFGYDREGAVVLGQLPLCGVWGFNTVMAAFAGGATAVLMPEFDASQAVTLIERHHVTYANGPDAFVRRLFRELETRGLAESSMRTIGFSTFTNDSRELVDWGDRLGISLTQVYGSSEQLALMLRRREGGDPADRSEPGGPTTNPDTRLRVRDPESGQLLAVGETGELETYGPNVMLGYLNGDGLDRSTFTEDGWVRTGDLGYLEDPTTFRFVTKDKDVLRLSGFLVDPAEIEGALERQPEVIEAKVVGVATSDGPRCVAFIRQPDGSELDEEGLLSRLSGDLATYKVPFRVIAIEEFPRIDGANGIRIQRLALRQQAEEAIR